MSGILAPEASVSSLASGLAGAAVAGKLGICVPTSAAAAAARRSTRRVKWTIRMSGLGEGLGDRERERCAGAARRGNKA